jgi:hypothetical protein
MRANMLQSTSRDLDRVYLMRQVRQDDPRWRSAHFGTTDQDGQETSELFALATTLLDVQAYPAIELAQLYHTPAGRPRPALAT